jgi:hypothetical protein
MSYQNAINHCDLWPFVTLLLLLLLLLFLLLSLLEILAREERGYTAAVAANKIIQCKLNGV